jgi:hypothetical protein
MVYAECCIVYFFAKCHFAKCHYISDIMTVSICKFHYNSAIHNASIIVVMPSVVMPVPLCKGHYAIVIISVPFRMPVSLFHCHKAIAIVTTPYHYALSLFHVIRHCRVFSLCMKLTLPVIKHCHYDRVIMPLCQSHSFTATMLSVIMLSVVMLDQTLLEAM